MSVLFATAPGSAPSGPGVLFTTLWHPCKGIPLRSTNNLLCLKPGIPNSVFTGINYKHCLVLGISILLFTGMA